MKELEPVIRVRELPPVCCSQRQYLPSLRDLTSLTARIDEPRVLSYLDQGVDCGLYNDPGLMYDVLRPGTRIDFTPPHGIIPEPQRAYPNLMLTDGTWVWPGALIYYVAVYHL